MRLLDVWWENCIGDCSRYSCSSEPRLQIEREDKDGTTRGFQVCSSGLFRDETCCQIEKREASRFEKIRYVINLLLLNE